MHFVDDIDFETPDGRRVNRAIEQFAHAVDLRIRGRVYFNQVNESSGADLDAGIAFSARLIGNTSLTIQRLGNDSRKRGFADAARASKQIGMMQPLLLERIGQCADHMLLSDQLGKRLGPPLAG